MKYIFYLILLLSPSTAMAGWSINSTTMINDPSKSGEAITCEIGKTTKTWELGADGVYSTSVSNHGVTIQRKVGEYKQTIIYSGAICTKVINGN